MRVLGAVLFLLLTSESAGADAPDEAQTLVHHVAPAEATAGTALRLVAAVENAWRETALVCRYRRMGSDQPFQSATFERSSAGGYYALIPANDIDRPGVEYYLAGVGAGGDERPHFASAKEPHQVRVEPPGGLRWIEVERRRLGGRLSRVRLGFEAVDFGDSFGTDRYFRGEVDWTYRLVTGLYSFTLGYGFIEGETPGSREMPATIDNAARYGVGTVRLRLHPSLWVDAGVTLGFTDEGFSAGARGDLIFGKDWRSCVVAGFEWMEDMKGRVYMRLQWDTAVPFLMSAEAAMNSLPEANLDGGVTLEYDLTYPLSERISLGASLSYSARKARPGFLGGGLFSSIEL